MARIVELKEKEKNKKSVRIKYDVLILVTIVIIDDHCSTHCSCYSSVRNSLSLDFRRFYFNLLRWNDVPRREFFILKLQYLNIAQAKQIINLLINKCDI